MGNATSINVQCAGCSDTGRVRRINEDQFLIANLNRSMRIQGSSLDLESDSRIFGKSHGKLFAVADGVGGHTHGELASQLAIDGLLTWFLHSMDWMADADVEELESKLPDSFDFAQTQLLNEIATNPNLQGMATTLTMIYVDWPTAFVVHVGDSRCYHIRNGSLRQVTTDHDMATLTNNLARLGDQDLDDEDTKPMKAPRHFEHILWNVIGGHDTSIKPEYRRFELEPNDAIVLCTDGLTKYISDTEICDAVSHTSALAGDVCNSLVDQANSRGGGDNVTIVLSKFDDCSENPTLDNRKLAQPSTR